MNTRKMRRQLARTEPNPFHRVPLVDVPPLMRPMVNGLRTFERALMEVGQTLLRSRESA